MAMEHRTLMMRANRMLGAALAEHNLVRLEDLEVANEKLLEIAASGEPRRTTVLGILVYDMKVLREEDLLLHMVDEQGAGVVDLRGYEVPDDVRNATDTAECWATWSVPYDREEDFTFIATAYYLSPPVRSYWEKKFGGQIIWQATTMEVIADFLERLEHERAKTEPAGSRPPTPVPGKTPTAPPFPRPATSTAAPFAKGPAAPSAPPAPRPPTTAPFARPPAAPAVKPT